jgi:hypothetical protein
MENLRELFGAPKPVEPKKPVVKIERNSIPLERYCFISDKFLYITNYKQSLVQSKQSLVKLLNIDLLKNKMIRSNCINLLQEYLQEFEISEIKQDDHYFEIFLKNKNSKAKVGFTFEDIDEENHEIFFKILQIENCKDKKQVGVLTSNDLKKIKTALNFTSNNWLKESLVGVLIENDNVVSTDTEIMYFDKLDSNLNIKVILYPDDLKNYFKTTKELSDVKVYYSDELKRVYFGEDYDIRLCSGNYPDWQKITSLTNGSNIKFNRSDIPSKIQKDNELTNTIQFTNGGFTKKREKTTDNYNFKIESRDKFDFFINYNHLSLIKQSCKDEIMTFYWKNSHYPVLVNDRFLFMPIIVGAVK